MERFEMNFSGFLYPAAGIFKAAESFIERVGRQVFKVEQVNSGSSVVVLKVVILTVELPVGIRNVVMLEDFGESNQRRLGDAL